MSRSGAGAVAGALAGALAGAVTLLAGCGSGEPSRPQEVLVEAGPQEVRVLPTQYCLDGEGQRYDVAPPVLEVSPGIPIRVTVPEAVAERGWSVQVFDERLEEQIGEVPVDAGQAVLEEIGSSDVVPPAFYLVVVEGPRDDCGGLAGAWPVGFLRAGGDLGGSAPASPAG